MVLNRHSLAPWGRIKDGMMEFVFRRSFTNSTVPKPILNEHWTLMFCVLWIKKVHQHCVNNCAWWQLQGTLLQSPDKFDRQSANIKQMCTVYYSYSWQMFVPVWLPFCPLASYWLDHSLLESLQLNLDRFLPIACYAWLRPMSVIFLTASPIVARVGVWRTIEGNATPVWNQVYPAHRRRRPRSAWWMLHGTPESCCFGR